MGWIPSAYLDLSLTEIALSDEEVVCSQVPTTFFNCVRPDLRLASTAYVAGDIVRPGTPNGFVFVCSVGGTTGSSEPGYQLTQDAETTDGTVTWVSHENYALANTSLVSEDFTISDYSTGRRLAISAKNNVTVHTTGTPIATAVISTSTETLHGVADAQVSIVVNNQTITPVDWEADTLYFVGNHVFAGGDSYTFYTCIGDGTSDATPPIWPTVQDETVMDNDVNWMCNVATNSIDSGTVIDFKTLNFTHILIAA